MIKRHLILILPILLYWTWTYWIRDYCIFYVGSEFPNSTRIVFTILTFGTILFLLSAVTILFCFLQLPLLFFQKKWAIYISIRNIVLIVSFILVFQIKTKPYLVPFASGLKNYYAKEIDLLRFQQWIESGQAKEVEMRLSEPYDKYNFPGPLLGDIRKIQTVRIDIKRTASGKLYLKLWSYVWLIGDYGFVVGINKDELPFENYEPTEYRVEIDNKSFVWVRERF